MANLSVHTLETAPEASKPLLEKTQQSLGFIPNLMATFANSPAMLEAYAVLSSHFEKTDLTPTERQIVLMTNNRLNGCEYCMAAHTTVSQMQKISTDVISALRDGSEIADPKLQALHVFAARINEARGRVLQADIDAFLEAGYSEANILDVILGAGLKTMSNYTDHIAKTSVDAAFQSNVWNAPEDQQAVLAHSATRDLGEASVNWA